VPNLVCKFPEKHNNSIFSLLNHEMKINFRLSLVKPTQVNNFKVIGTTILAFVLLVSLFSSCVRERDFDTTSAEDNMWALFVYNDAIDIANEGQSLVSGDNLYSYDPTSTFTSITRSANNVVINFDTVNHLCKDGRYRRGKVLLSYTGNYKDSAETRTITFEDYYINDDKVQGTVTVTGMGRNADGHHLYAVVTEGQMAIQDTLGTYVFNATLDRTQTAGAGTVVWGDDVYELTGTSQGNDIYNNNIAMRIITPIVKIPSFICNYLQAGTVEVQPQGHTFRSINLGEGNCDSEATVTIDTKQHAITLK
jgi:hypothetical protein